MAIGTLIGASYLQIGGGSVPILNSDGDTLGFVRLPEGGGKYEFVANSPFAFINAPADGGTSQVTGTDSVGNVWTLSIGFNGDNTTSSLTIDNVGTQTNISSGVLAGVTIAAGTPLGVVFQRTVDNRLGLNIIAFIGGKLSTRSEGTFIDSKTNATKTGMYAAGTSIFLFKADLGTFFNKFIIMNWADSQLKIEGTQNYSMPFNSIGSVGIYLNQDLNDYINALEFGDPYALGGFSGGGGGTGSFSGTGDNIGIPSLPTLSAVSAGFIKLFNPSASQMAALASYMWSGAFDMDTYRKIFADPMDCILGLSIVPVSVPSGGLAAVQVGNISTGVSMTTAASQYVEVDCGTLNVEEYWGAYLDYDPYTKAEIYLPYIGTHPIAVDDIMGKAVHVVYHVDILSGACVAYVQCGGTVLYSFIGQCSSSIPITGNDWTNVINGVLSIAGSIGTMVATGGATAPAAVGNIVSTAVNSLKPAVEKSGSLSGTGGMMGVQTPYLILTRPRQALPENQNTFMGYPSFITEDLSTLRGYTEIEQIHLENVPATSGEINELEGILKGGVIF